MDYKVSPEVISLPVLTSLHIEILGRRLPPPPANAMMHFTDKIGKLFSSTSVFLHYHILGDFWIPIYMLELLVLPLVSF